MSLTRRMFLAGVSAASFLGFWRPRAKPGVYSNTYSTTY